MKVLKLIFIFFIGCALLNAVQDPADQHIASESDTQFQDLPIEIKDFIFQKLFMNLSSLDDICKNIQSLLLTGKIYYQIVNDQEFLKQVVRISFENAQINNFFTELLNSQSTNLNIPTHNLNMPFTQIHLDSTDKKIILFAYIGSCNQKLFVQAKELIMKTFSREQIDKTLHKIILLNNRTFQHKKFLNRTINSLQNISMSFKG